MKFFTAPIVALTLAACALAQIRVSLNPPRPTECAPESIIMNGGRPPYTLTITGQGARKTEIYTAPGSTFRWTEDYKSGVPIHVHVVGSGRATGDSPTVTVAPGKGGCALVS